jgi:hypothetical protein
LTISSINFLFDIVPLRIEPNEKIDIEAIQEKYWVSRDEN